MQEKCLTQSGQHWCFPKLIAISKLSILYFYSRCTLFLIWTVCLLFSPVFQPELTLNDENKFDKEQGIYIFAIGFRKVCVWTMALILDSYTEISEHFRNNPCYLIWLKPLIRSRKSQIGFNSQNRLFPSMRAQHVLSYHLR